MFSVLIGIVLVLFSVFAALPAGIGLGWGKEIVFVLKGAAPVLALLTGAFAILVGSADIKDRREAKLEEAAAEKEEEKLAKAAKKS